MRPVDVAQRTLAREFQIQGVGIHTGARSTVTVWPASDDTGRLVRIGDRSVEAVAENVRDTRRCTSLGTDGVVVHTVEHLLSALFACGIDNCLIEVDGPELPILDGSALPYIDAIEQSGIIAQKHPAEVFWLESEITIQERGSFVRAAPFGEVNSGSSVTEAEFGFDVSATVEFDLWPEGNRTTSIQIGSDWSRTMDGYRHHVAPARTFAFRQEVEQLIAAGLAKGGSLDNALIITPPDEFSSPLRVPSEWCAHKLLDIIGDLALVGTRLSMKLESLRPGHASNVQMALALRKVWQERQAEQGGQI